MKKLIIATTAFVLLTGLVRGVEERIERIASEIDATVGVAAIHVETGRKVGVRHEERFPMGSVNKFPAAIAFLRKVDAKLYSLGDDVTIQPAEFAEGYSPIRVRARGQAVTMELGELLEAMIRQNDNTAANVLRRLSGGAQEVEVTFRELGLDDTDTTTPAQMVALLERFHSGKVGLSAASQARLVSLMTTTVGGQRRIRAGTPSGASVANQTGTLPGAANDVGIITSPNGRDHVAIAVFTRGGGNRSTLTQRERAVASITRAVYRDLVEWPSGKAASGGR
jgi:beta-lactamase class A